MQNEYPVMDTDLLHFQESAQLENGKHFAEITINFLTCVSFDFSYNGITFEMYVCLFPSYKVERERRWNFSRQL